MNDDTPIRVGYGWRRSDREFDRLNVKKYFVDVPGTDRLNRTEMLKAARDNNLVIVVIAEGDLGRGNELRLMRERIKQYGCTIETPKDRGEVKQAKPKGRRPKQKWTDEEKKKICPTWQDQDYSASYVIKRAIEVTGRHQDRNSLNRNCGRRTKEE